MFKILLLILWELHTSLEHSLRLFPRFFKRRYNIPYLYNFPIFFCLLFCFLLFSSTRSIYAATIFLNVWPPLGTWGLQSRWISFSQKLSFANSFFAGSGTLCSAFSMLWFGLTFVYSVKTNISQYISLSWLSVRHSFVVYVFHILSAFHSISKKGRRDKANICSI